MKMNEVKSRTWTKLFEISCDTQNNENIINAIIKDTGCSREEAEDYMNPEWMTVCEDGIIIWED